MTFDVERGEGRATLWVRLHSWDLTDQVFPYMVTEAFPRTDPEEWPVPWSSPIFGVYFKDEEVFVKLKEFEAALKEWPFDCEKGKSETTELGNLFNDLLTEAMVPSDSDEETLKKLQELTDFIGEYKAERKKEAGWTE